MKPDFSKGLVPAVVQNAETGKVLMLACMDEAAWSKTRETGRAWFHSRERGLWEKGATSGNEGRGSAPRLRPRQRAPASEPGRPGVPHRGGVLLFQSS
jgi:Phosphoribosyl-AMP cyclohydrolase